MIRLDRDGVWHSDLLDVSPKLKDDRVQLPTSRWVEEQERLRRQWRRFWAKYPRPKFMSYDVRVAAAEELALAGCEHLRCGAQNRFGEPCGKYHLHANGRCRFHGGLSTGPKSDLGKQKVTKNLPNPMESNHSQPGKTVSTSIREN